MDIAIIGAGRVGSTLGRGLAAAGHRVHYARRDPEAPLPERLLHEGATTGAAAEVVARSQAVLLATPWAAARAALADAGDLGGRPLFDATNPIGPGLTLTHGHTDSGAEQVQRWAPGARVVKVFNTTGMENMAAPRYPTGAAVMLACGDDGEAVALAVRLAGELGFEAHAFGPLSSARLLEPFALVWIRLAMVQGLGRGFAFGLLKR
jgi:predicted dinucleotide-binding enzyme